MTVNKFLRLCTLGGVAMIAAGCSVGSVYERYRASAPVIVRVGCGSAVYEVFENYLTRTVMVRSNAIASVAPMVCSNDSAGRMTAEERVRSAAELYFVNVNRSECKIRGGRALTPMHAEFDYSCTP